MASIFCSNSKKLGKDIITEIRLIQCFHSSDHAADVLILYNQRISETQKLLSGSTAFFNIRDNQLDAYQAKIWKLGKAARWEVITKNVVSFFESEEMSRETYAFLFRVLRK